MSTPRQLLLDRVADTIEDKPHVTGWCPSGSSPGAQGEFPELDSFSMEYVVGTPGVPGCNTCGCIAGWICALFAPDITPGMQDAADLVRLNQEQAEALFMGAAWMHLSAVTPEEAAEACRRFTGIREAYQAALQHDGALDGDDAYTFADMLWGHVDRERHEQYRHRPAERHHLDF